MRLIQTILIICAAEQLNITCPYLIVIPVGVCQHGIIYMIHLVKAAVLVHALDGGVGSNPFSMLYNEIN